MSRPVWFSEGSYAIRRMVFEATLRLSLEKSISEDKEESKQQSKDEEILQKTEDEIFIKKESSNKTLEPSSEKNFTLKLLKSPLVWLLSLQFFLGSLRTIPCRFEMRLLSVSLCKYR